MKIIFRVDSSPLMGSGHLMRCLTLAYALREQSSEVAFICRNHEGHLIDFLNKAAFPVNILSAPKPSVPLLEDYALWLGVPPREDADETLEILRQQRPDWLIVDHYGLDHSWEVMVRPYVGKLMVIDDLANRLHECDLLLDSCEDEQKETRYYGLVPSNCQLLLGARYSLLRPEYATYHSMQRQHSGEVKRVLLFFSSSDPYNLTGRTLKVLTDGLCSAWHVDVVVGEHYPCKDQLEEQVAHRPYTTLYRSLPHLADLMVKADLAIGAGGATSWERLCLGLPSVVIGMADNQLAVCHNLKQQGLIEYVGTANEVSNTKLKEIIIRLSQDSTRLKSMSAKAQLIVDGLGSLRTVKTLCSMP